MQSLIRRHRRSLGFSILPIIILIAVYILLAQPAETAPSYSNRNNIAPAFSTVDKVNQEQENTLDKTQNETVKENSSPLKPTVPPSITPPPVPPAD